MALNVNSRIKESTTTTGTGTITLAGAEDGFQSFAVIGNTNTTYYTIINGNNWEVGTGSYTVSGTTLSRDTVLASSSSGSKITLSGKSDVFCTYPAEKALLLNASNQINGNNVVIAANILDNAVITSKILDSNVTTGKIADSNVTTGKIADNAVTLAKMDSGTDGNIISYDASGNPVAVATGSSGQVLTSAGAGAVPTFADAASGLEWQSSIVTASTLTAVGNRGYWINTTSNICTITLPSSATVGDRLVFTDYARTWNTNKIVLDSNGLNYQGSPDTMTVEYSTDGQSLDIVYSGATKGWIANTDEATVRYIPAYDIDYLVVGGGGGGGGNSGAGGGAGGFRTSTQSMPTGGLLVTVVIGDGGAAAISGSLSQFSGPGLTTISSAGGGGGGGFAIAGSSGGSGGGGGTGSDIGAVGAGGAGNTPSTSPSQGNNGGSGNPNTSIGNPYTEISGGGGGGAGAVGTAGIDNVAGNGGAGTASSITGASVTRAGGGGGGTYGTTAGSGGAGGGGAGAKGSGAATAGTVNTGGGGGAQGVGGTGSSGGKGIVILSIPTASYSDITSGSPTVSTSGSNTILTFTGSGTYSG